ncbi:MAG: glycosyltransferase [Rhodothalassiaceae bacterium]
MKLVELCEYYSPQGGGVRIYVENKLAAARQCGIDLLVIAPGTENREEPHAGGRIAWVRSPRLPLDPRYHVFGRAAAVHAILERERPDLVEVSSLLRAPAIAASWGRPVRHLLFLHSDPIASYLEPLLARWPDGWGGERIREAGWSWLRRLAARFDGTIVAADWLADRLAAHGLKAPAVIPLGVETGLFRPALRSETLRRTLLGACGIDHAEARLLLVVGRLHPEKRVGLLLDAFARLRDRLPVGLCIIGDGPLAGKIARRAASEQGVHFAGPVRDRTTLARVMASADLLLHGCASETFGLVIGEALSSGLPVIVPDRGGAAAYAREAVAEVYRSGEVTDCVRAVSRMLARLSPDLRAQCARAARASLIPPMAHFERLFEHYRRLAAGLDARARAAATPASASDHSLAITTQPLGMRQLP